MDMLYLEHYDLENTVKFAPMPGENEVTRDSANNQLGNDFPRIQQRVFITSYIQC